MTLGIKTKHFLTLFTISGVVVLGMYLFMQWSFHRGFINYVNTQVLNGKDKLADSLIDHYRQQGGNWDGLRGNHRLWRQLQRAAGPQSPDGLPRSGALPPGPPPNGSHPDRPSPHRIPLRPDPLRIGPSMALVAADQQTLLIGGQSSDIGEYTLRPLELEGRLIGYLGLTTPAGLADPTELLYVEQQSRIFALIALVMILISMGLGFPLIHHLLVPVKAMTKGAGKLADGDYATRIPVLSRDELGKLSRVFNLLAATLEKNEVSRRRWMADISHELRTPLAILSGEIEALRDGVRTADEATLAALYGEIQRMNRLVGDLHELTLSDIGALSYRKHPLDPVVVLEQSVELFTPRMAAAGITLAPRLPEEGVMVLNADPHRFQQLVTNLLENSLRYTDSNGRVEISLETVQGELLLLLQDSPPGVTAEQLPRLFERLYRVEASRSRTRGGTGLGLAICKNIVEAHQGRIEALPSTLGGLRIEIRLPLT